MPKEPNKNNRPKETKDTGKPNEPKSHIRRDSAYKFLYSQKEMFKSLLRDFLPHNWEDHVDLGTLRKENASYVSEDLIQRHDDLIWSLKYKGTTCYIFVLLEFQNAVDHFMAVRIMAYISLLYQDIINQQHLSSKEKLPFVFPMVIYTGTAPWTAPLRVMDLIDTNRESSEFLESSELDEYAIKNPYFLLNMREVREEKLPQDSLAAILIRLERANDPQGFFGAIDEVTQKYPQQRHRPLTLAFKNLA
ncbi:MAG: Rpn family recombination-promoting nuclease/putative transposase, partial [Deltaproteobacteria bacterium]|nr:Rpn family recombination-promoting nuclease/putative transposase [Deltaproteobacteria bacterium]